MKLIALKNFPHAEDTINVVDRQDGEEFEVTDEGHGQRLIDAKLAKLSGDQTPLKPSEEAPKEEAEEVEEPSEEAPNKSKK